MRDRAGRQTLITEKLQHAATNRQFQAACCKFSVISDVAERNGCRWAGRHAGSFVARYSTDGTTRAQPSGVPVDELAGERMGVLHEHPPELLLALRAKA